MTDTSPPTARKPRKGPAPKEVPSLMIRIPGELKPAVDQMKQAWYALEKRANRP